jgi:hypothetical protein
MLTNEKVLSGCDICEKNKLIQLMKKEFNVRVQRIKKAEKYYKLESTKDSDVEKTLKSFLQIYDEAIRIANEIENITGEKLDIEIIENGFKECTDEQFI